MRFRYPAHEMVTTDRRGERENSGSRLARTEQRVENVMPLSALDERIPMVTVDLPAARPAPSVGYLAQDGRVVAAPCCSSGSPEVLRAGAA